jgi:hypothetical protein
MMAVIKHEIKHGHDSCLIEESNNDRLVGLVISDNHRIWDADLHRSRSRWLALVAMEEEVMAEKWTIRALTEEEYPGTQLQYEVRDETEVVSLHFWEEDAQQMAAVPLLHSADVTERIVAALAAVEGE